MTIRKRPPHAAPPRETYRHGDLRRALLDAGIALAREGGPTAVVLREATRQAGVAPNAAYRHFANHQALFDAVRAHALGALAQAIEREWRKALRVREPAAQARQPSGNAVIMNPLVHPGHEAPEESGILLV